MLAWRRFRKGAKRARLSRRRGKSRTPRVFECLDLRLPLHGPGDAVEPDLAALSAPTPRPQPLEGLEDTDLDLVAFAKSLANAGVIMYGAGWCRFCTEQKELFQDGGDYLPFVEVTHPNRTPNQIAIDNNITQYPTWVFPDSSRLVGKQDLATLSQKAGIPIPRSNTPYLSEIPNLQLLAGSPLMVPLNGYDPQNSPLTYSVTSDNPEVIPILQTGNRSLRISVAGFGDMVFYLFEDRAPRATSRIIQLVESGFYSNIEFHRVINNFVIQAGDPTGLGNGGSTLGPFDDQFDLDLQHNRTGILSMAKSQDDTNDSQFFITEGTARHLDFNHTIFGVLVEGEKNRDNISNTSTDSNDRPQVAVKINSASVFTDVENAVLLLKSAPGVTSGEANVTVTVRDPQGHEFSRTFRVTIAPDTVNSNPFLADIPPVRVVTGGTATFFLQGIDAEGDPVTFWDQGDLAALGRYIPVHAHPDLHYNVDRVTGRVDVNPQSGLVGKYKISVAVGANATNPWDYQVVQVDVAPVSPTQVDLASETDTGASMVDNVTNHAAPQFFVAGVTQGANVRLYAGNEVLAQATAQGVLVSFTIDGSMLSEGSSLIAATQEISGVESDPGPVMHLVMDRVAPVFTSAPFDVAYARLVYEYLPQLSESNLAFALADAPGGMTMHPATGAITWIPTPDQLGGQTFKLRATDRAGNTQELVANVSVSPNPWRNPVVSHDVDDDGEVTLADVEALIDAVAAGGFRWLSTPGVAHEGMYLDVNDDGRFSPMDVLGTINAVLASEGSTAALVLREARTLAGAEDITAVDLALAGLAMKEASDDSVDERVF